MTMSLTLTLTPSFSRTALIFVPRGQQAVELQVDGQREVRHVAELSVIRRATVLRMPSSGMRS
jgi:hypothetical protein